MQDGQNKLMKFSVLCFPLRPGAIPYLCSPVQAGGCPRCSQSELKGKAQQLNRITALCSIVPNTERRKLTFHLIRP